MLRRARGDADGMREQDDAGTAQRTAVQAVLRSTGSPLAEPLRREMEDRLDADFSDVRVHRGGAARASAAAVAARAYTSGNHVVLGEGGGDKHTLAHELTYVIQQRQGPVAGTDKDFGKADATNRRQARGFIEERNESANPQPGEAFVIVACKPDAKKEMSQFHAAAVVARDGQDCVALEVWSDNGNPPAKEAANAALYTVTDMERSFHSAYGGEGAYFGEVGPITVVVRAKGVSADPGQRSASLEELHLRQGEMTAWAQAGGLAQYPDGPW
ncbi:DUF4157 domain-containing protein [Streptomyces sp. NEAU-Y11]|uniref:eCIS core domain-containing protein n=1 Tax=Streptomyces cucumeris TaxID=2962890 RepID=UPI0035ABBDBB